MIEVGRSRSAMVMTTLLALYEHIARNGNDLYEIITPSRVNEHGHFSEATMHKVFA